MKDTDQVTAHDRESKAMNLSLRDEDTEAPALSVWQVKAPWANYSRGILRAGNAAGNEQACVDEANGNGLRFKNAQVVLDTDKREGTAMGGIVVSENQLDATRERAKPGRTFLHDLVMTLGAEAGAVLSGLILTSIVSRWLGARALSEYLLLRRVLSWMVSGTLLGLATGLPRYVAYAAGHREQEDAGYFLAASICMTAAAIATGVLMVLYRSACAQWLFGNRQETGLVMALALLLLGYAIHRAVTGYYRGLLEMVRANVLELCNAALLPVVVVLALFHSQPIGMMMFVTGGLMAVIALLFAMPVMRRVCRRDELAKLRRRCTELLKYSVPRVPGEFGLATLMTLGPMLAAHYMNIAQVSPLLLGLNMLMVIGYAAGPLGVILLSKVSMMLGKNQRGEVQVRMRLLVAAVMEVAAFTCMQLVVFADVVVRAWVGPGFENQMGVIRLVLLAIPFYLFYVALRSTIDAATVKPLNTGNVLISLAAYLLLISVCIVVFPNLSLLDGIAGSLLGSQILLAVLTARTFRKFYGLGIPWRRLAPSFAAAAMLGAAAFGLRQAIGAPISLPAAILAEVVFTAVYVTVLAKRGSGWIVYTWNVGVLRRGSWPASISQE
jgi:O-antigen/teichoic acid export membrane protein